MYGNGYALVFSSALTSVIGLLFWVAAAHGYDQVSVGRGSALVYAIMFLAGVAQLNLMNVLIRFVPVAAGRARGLVARAYLLGGGLAALTGVIFALGTSVWAPELTGLLHDGSSVVAVGIACGIWAIFVMQDGVLVAVGRAGMVAAENAVFSVLKLGLLVALAVTLPTGGVPIAWFGAAAVAVVAVTAYLFLHALPAFAGSAVGHGERLSVRGIAGYLGGDFLGASCWLACTQLLPVLVLGMLGAAATAAFTVAWTIAYALYLVPAAMGQSLVAHTATDVDGLAVARAGTERRTFALVIPAAVIAVLGAPWIMRLFGPEYADTGAWVLRLAALSAIPNVITAVAVSAARVTRRVGTVVAILGTLSLLSLTLSVVLLPVFGGAGAAGALLVAQCVVAGVLLLMRANRLPRPISGPFNAAMNASRVRRVAPTALADGWRVQHQLHGLSDSAIAAVGPKDGDPTALLKAAETPSGRTILRRQCAVLAQLHDDDRLNRWRATLPRILGSGEVNGISYLVETRIPGRDARTLVTDPATATPFVDTALATIAELHRATAHPVPLDGAVFERCVEAPASIVRQAIASRETADLDRLVGSLERDLRGRRLPIGWTHGDYSPDNILVDADARVTGIVDWGQAVEDGPTAVDVASLLLTVEAERGGRELGAIVLAWLADDTAPAAHLVAATQRALGGDDVDGRALLLLGWLHMVAANLAKSTRYGANPLWLNRNVRAVVRSAEVVTR
jgi:O-antigen/teichoic acid export membrane protein/aminoglycoside phosphotransferase (APT) family kinase protein